MTIQEAFFVSLKHTVGETVLKKSSRSQKATWKYISMPDLTGTLYGLEKLGSGGCTSIGNYCNGVDSISTIPGVKEFSRKASFALSTSIVLVHAGLDPFPVADDEKRTNPKLMTKDSYSILTRLIWS